MGRFFLLGLAGCVHLDVATKNACAADADCVVKGEACVANACEVVVNGACQTHFDCDAEHICESGQCTVFVPLTFDSLLPAIAAGNCQAVAGVCGEATMQKVFGSDYLNTCESATTSSGAALGAPPADAKDFDAKMAAACVYDFARSAADKSVHLSSFHGWPPTCARVLKNGSLGSEASCFAAQAQCEPGMECAFGPSFFGAPGQENDYFCIPAYGQRGSACVTTFGEVLSDCDLGLFCDWNITNTCQPRLPSGTPCTPPAANCMGGQPSCDIDVDPCVDGSSCSADSGTCAPTPPTCPFGAL